MVLHEDLSCLLLQEPVIEEDGMELVIGEERIEEDEMM
jgi:hypothetical protein